MKILWSKSSFFYMKYQKVKLHKFGFFLLLWVTAIVFYCDTFSASPKEEVIRAIKLQWEKPDYLVAVPVVAVRQEFAIADWLQGNRGGRAMLRKMHGVWQTLACGDAKMKTVAQLKQFGVPEPQAQLLIQALNEQEQHLTQEELQVIDGFSGIMELRQHHH